MLPTASLVHQWYQQHISEPEASTTHYLNPYLASMVPPPEEQLSMELALEQQAWLPMPLPEQQTTTHFCFSQNETES